MEEKEGNVMAAPWLELPPEIMSTILQKLGTIEIVRNAEKVCTTWRNLCHEPAMWRAINMEISGAETLDTEDDLEKICCQAVDRSQGQLLDINLEFFGSDYLLNYIAERSTKLKRLRLVCSYSVSDKGLSEAVEKLPLLEELNLYYISITKEAIETIGRSCHALKSFKMNKAFCSIPSVECDEEAIAIAENMPQLRHLQLFGNTMTNEGLEAILNCCTHLESLDLRRCFNVNLEGDLGKRCSRRIKYLRPPQDPSLDYGLDAEMHDSESFDEDYPYGFSDIDLISDDNDYYEFSDSSYYYDDEDTFFE